MMKNKATIHVQVADELKPAMTEYIEQSRKTHDLEMSREEMPQGIMATQLLLTVPLLGLTGYLCCMAPMIANPAFADPVSIAALTRTSVRLLSLNIAF
jgi:hypothetical protein